MELLEEAGVLRRQMLYPAELRARFQRMQNLDCKRVLNQAQNPPSHFV